MGVDEVDHGDDIGGGDIVIALVIVIHIHKAGRKRAWPQAVSRGARGSSDHLRGRDPDDFPAGVGRAGDDCPREPVHRR